MSPPKRPAESTEALRASLIDHARRLIARDGAAALTMRALAAEADCAVGLPYKVFTDRHDLVVQICHAEFQRLGDACDELATRAGTATVGANLAWFADLLLGSPAVTLAHEVFADETLAKAVTARVHETGIGPAAFETVLARYLAAEKQNGRRRPRHRREGLRLRPRRRHPQPHHVRRRLASAHTPPAQTKARRHRHRHRPQTLTHRFGDTHAAIRSRHGPRAVRG